MTGKNFLGLCSTSTQEQNCVLAFPSEQLNIVQVVYFNKDKDNEVKKFKVHDTAISMLRLSQDGSMLATASQKGTLIRIFDPKTEEKMQELRRGAQQAVITDICIDVTNKYVSCASDQGTIHVFNIKKDEAVEREEEADEGQAVLNKKSTFKGLSGAFSYFGSEWSFQQFKVKDSHCKCAIINNKIFGISK